jgi:hypothetical protein
VIEFAKDFVSALRGDHALIALADPRQCACGRMVCFLINRDGKTRCIECDKEHLENGKR